MPPQLDLNPVSQVGESELCHQLLQSYGWSLPYGELSRYYHTMGIVAIKRRQVNEEVKCERSNIRRHRQQIRSQFSHQAFH